MTLQSAERLEDLQETIWAGDSLLWNSPILAVDLQSRHFWFSGNEQSTIVKGDNSERFIWIDNDYGTATSKLHIVNQTTRKLSEIKLNRSVYNPILLGKGWMTDQELFYIDVSKQ